MDRAKTTHDSSPKRRSYLGSRPASGNGRDCPPKAAGKEPQRRRVAHATRKQATPSSGLGRATAKRRRLLTQAGRRSCTKIRTVTTIAACRSGPLGGIALGRYLGLLKSKIDPIDHTRRAHTPPSGQDAAPSTETDKR